MTFYDIIRDWVAKNYGESEAEDPSWSITELAKELMKATIDPKELNANTKWLVYDELREWNLEQDIKAVAKEYGCELTDKDMARIKSYYYHADDETYDLIRNIIENVTEESNYEN